MVSADKIIYILRWIYPSTMFKLTTNVGILGYVSRIRELSRQSELSRALKATMKVQEASALRLVQGNLF